MIKFVIAAGDHIIGMAGHVSTDAFMDFERYVKINGFSTSEDARAAAEALGISDAAITEIAVR